MVPIQAPKPSYLISFEKAGINSAKAVTGIVMSLTGALFCYEMQKKEGLIARGIGIVCGGVLIVKGLPMAVEGTLSSTYFFAKGYFQYALGIN